VKRKKALTQSGNQKMARPLGTLGFMSRPLGVKGTGQGDFLTCSFHLPFFQKNGLFVYNRCANAAFCRFDRLKIVFSIFDLL